MSSVVSKGEKSASSFFFIKNGYNSQFQTINSPKNINSNGKLLKGGPLGLNQQRLKYADTIMGGKPSFDQELLLSELHME